MVVKYDNIWFEADIKSLPISCLVTAPQITIRDAKGKYVTLMCMTLLSVNAINRIFSGNEEEMKETMQIYLKYLKQEVSETEKLMV